MKETLNLFIYIYNCRVQTNGCKTNSLLITLGLMYASKHVSITAGHTDWGYVNKASQSHWPLVACLSLQQSHFVWEEMDHVLLPKGRREQVAERGACGGEQARQHKTLPGPEYCTSQHVLKDRGRGRVWWT